MSESQPRDKSLLQDSEYNVIKQLEKEADFLYSAVEKYIRDSEKDNKPELVKLWNTIKEDEQNHLNGQRNKGEQVWIKRLSVVFLQKVCICTRLAEGLLWVKGVSKDNAASNVVVLAIPRSRVTFSLVHPSSKPCLGVR